MVNAASPASEVSTAPARFLAGALGAFEEAVKQTGRISHSFLIAQRRVRIECAGPALADAVTAALAHLSSDDRTEAELLIRVFDSASTGSAMPSVSQA